MSWTQSRRIYVAEFKSGVLKVGITKQPLEGRRSNLTFKGERPVRMHFGPHHECGGWPEWELIARMRRIACVIDGREWFVGARFNAVRQLVNQVTRMALVVQAEQAAREAA